MAEQLPARMKRLEDELATLRERLEEVAAAGEPQAQQLAALDAALKAMDARLVKVEELAALVVKKLETAQEKPLAKLLGLGKK